jgi:para-nitrobenzyl esterase
VKRAVAPLLAAAILAATALVAGESPMVVRTDAGRMSGLPLRDGGAAFLGIPYAQPPLASLRWRAPLPLRPWRGVRAVTALGAPCLQAAEGWNNAVASRASEDCLTLNVWTPLQEGAGLPVMVWIHGGAFTGGAGSDPMFDGERLMRHGVIVVTLNYRLGVFGFLAPPDAGAASANFGLRDQIEALHWVQRNIARFGGDAHRITLFGQSAGAASVAALMTSPLAQGLFQQAIIESGAPSAMLAPQPLAVARDVARRFADAVAPGTTLDQLRAMPASRVLEQWTTHARSTGGMVPIGLVIDGDVLTSAPAEAFATGRAAQIPLLLGNNARELSPDTSLARLQSDIERQFGAGASRLREVYGLAAPVPPADPVLGSAAAQFATDTAFRCNTVRTAGEHARRNAVYEYQFEKSIPGLEAAGAAHSFELPYLWGTLTAGVFAGHWTDADRSLSELLQGYWTNFARSGDPNGAGLPHWPRFGEAGREYVRVTDDGVIAAANLRGEVCALLDSPPAAAAAAAKSPPRAPAWPAPTPNDTLVSPEIASDGAVTFRLYAPQASEAAIEGEMLPFGQARPMQRGADSVWSITLAGVPPGTYRYVFRVAGMALADPRNPEVSTTLTTARSLLHVSGVALEDVADVPHGAVAEVTYRSPVSSSGRRMHVYTPPGYDSGRGKDFPVLYLLHGGGDADGSWASVGRAGVILDNLIAAGRAVPMIVVMPAGHAPLADGLPGPRMAAMSGDPVRDPFTLDLLEAILPTIERDYRVAARPDRRAIAGLSMGGVQAANVGLTHSELFSQVAIFSSGWFDESRAEFERLHGEDLDAAARRLRLLWIAWGKDDPLVPANAAAMVELLRAHGLQPEVRVTAGAHDWPTWRAYLAEVAPRLFR